MGFVDTVMIGRLGTDAIAAVGISSFLGWLVSSIFLSLSVATVALVSRRIGEGNLDAAGEAGGQLYLLAIGTGLAIALIMFPAIGPLLSWIGTDPKVTRIGCEYLRIVILFAPFSFTSMVGNSVLRGAGDTRTPMFVRVGSNIMNVFGNWLLIFGIGPFPRLEVKGAAIATGVSIALGSAVTLYILTRTSHAVRVRRHHITRFQPELMLRALRIAAPNMGERLLTGFGSVVFMKILTILGTVSVAAHMIAVRVEAFSFMVGVGFSVAASTLTGQSLGARDPDLAERNIQRTGLIGFLTMSMMAVIFLLFAESIVRIFNPEPKVAEFAALCVMISAFEQPGLAFFMVYTGGLRGAGDTLSPMLITFAGIFIFRIPLVYIFGITLGWGITGVWTATVFDWTARAITAYVFLERGRWKSLQV